MFFLSIFFGICVYLNFPITFYSNNQGFREQILADAKKKKYNIIKIGSQIRVSQLEIFTWD